MDSVAVRRWLAGAAVAATLTVAGIWAQATSAARALAREATVCSPAAGFCRAILRPPPASCPALIAHADADACPGDAGYEVPAPENALAVFLSCAETQRVLTGWSAIRRVDGCLVDLQMLPDGAQAFTETVGAEVAATLLPRARLTDGARIPHMWSGETESMVWTPLSGAADGE